MTLRESGHASFAYFYFDFRDSDKQRRRNLLPSLLIQLAAIDECPNTSGIPSPRKEVLEVMNELVALGLPNLHICVTSRPEIDIQTVLQPLTPHPVSLHDETGQKQDIIDYVTSVVHSNNTMRRWRNEDKELVIKTLSEKANGM
jgi:hypothetical protein